MIELFSNNNNIYIFGAGKYAQSCYDLLKSFNKVPTAFLVSDIEKNPTNIEEIPVVQLDKILSKDKKATIIIALKEKKDVFVRLNNMGFNNIELYPEIKDYIFDKEEFDLRCEKCIYIFGAGKYGSACVNELLALGITPKGIIVTKKNNNPDTILGIKVFSISELPREDKKIIIIALKPDYREEVLKIITKDNLANILFFPECKKLFDYIRVKYNIISTTKNIMQLAWEARKEFYIPSLAFGVSEEKQSLEKTTHFKKKIKFSILVPLFNTNPIFLKEMIASVLNQTYPIWELCLIDGSDNDHSYVDDICVKASNKDNRIKYRKIQKNLGISGNTNACLDMASGNYISLLDHDDLLHPSALFETMKAIQEQNADFIYTDEAIFENPDLHKIIFAHFKPDFAPDYFNSCNYIAHFTSFSKKLLINNNIKFDTELDGAQDYDLFLKLLERATNIVHIPKCLYYWRGSPNSTSVNSSSKSYAEIAGQKAVQKHLDRLGVRGKVLLTKFPFVYRTKYELVSNPLISIIIPSCDHHLALKKCIDSIVYYTTYSNFEIIIVENNSKDKKTFEYYESIKCDERIKIITWRGIFNYSAINNYAFKYAKGDYIVLLNNDTILISPTWLEEMLMFAQQKDVGAVGAMLYYPSEKIQHAGVILGIGGVAGHSHKFFSRGCCGYANRLCSVQNYSAVTAACIMIPARVFKEVNGFNEKFIIAFNDVDLCMRIRKSGYKVIWTPYAELYHFESESRGYEDTPEKQKRFTKETALFRKNWEKELAKGDPYYNINLTHSREDFSYSGDVFDD